MGDLFSKLYKLLIDEQRGSGDRGPRLLPADRVSLAGVSPPPRPPRLTIAGGNRSSLGVLPDPGLDSGLNSASGALGLGSLRPPPSPRTYLLSRVRGLADDLSVAVHEWMPEAKESGLMQADAAAAVQLVSFINGWLRQAEEDGRLPQIEDAVLLASIRVSPLQTGTKAVNLDSLLRLSIVQYLEQKIQRQQQPGPVDGVVGAAAVGEAHGDEGHPAA